MLQELKNLRTEVRKLKKKAAEGEEAQKRLNKLKSVLNGREDNNVVRRKA